MTASNPDRLDRIESTLETVLETIQKLDADLRSTNEQVKKWDGRLWGLTLALISHCLGWHHWCNRCGDYPFLDWQLTLISPILHFNFPKVPRHLLSGVSSFESLEGYLQALKPS